MAGASTTKPPLRRRPVVGPEKPSADLRFEEVARIIGAKVDNPYDILGINHNMCDDNMKKRYLKLSLMVHPDKCTTHPQAHHAFIKLSKAYKDLQDTDKRKALDQKINLKEREEAAVDQYNKVKRSRTSVEQHPESGRRKDDYYQWVNSLVKSGSSFF